MAGKTLQVPVNHPGGVYPGAGKEPCVPNPRHVSGQNDIRPNFETMAPKHAKERQPTKMLPRNRAGGPLD